MSSTGEGTSLMPTQCVWSSTEMLATLILLSRALKLALAAQGGPQTPTPCHNH